MVDTFYSNSVPSFDNFLGLAFVFCYAQKYMKKLKDEKPGDPGVFFQHSSPKKWEKKILLIY